MSGFEDIERRVDNICHEYGNMKANELMAIIDDFLGTKSILGQSQEFYDATNPIKKFTITRFAEAMKNRMWSDASTAACETLKEAISKKELDLWKIEK